MRAARLCAAVALALWAGAALAQSGATAEFLDRLSAYEAELRRLTGQVEDVERRLREQKRDYEARLQDLEFRVIELEGGDPAAAFAAPGGGAPDAPPDAPEVPVGPAPTAPPADGPGAPPAVLGELEVPAQGGAGFEAAMRDLEALGPEAGQRSVERFLAESPADPMAGEAWRRLGQAYLDEGRGEEAARSFLRGVRDHPNQAAAPENLLGLGRALAAIGRNEDACGAFGEVSRRYPRADRATLDAAATAAFRAGCS